MWRFAWPTVAAPLPAWARSIASPADTARFQRVLREAPAAARDGAEPYRRAVLQRVHAFFRRCMRWLVLAGALGFVIQLVTIRRGGNGLLAVQLALLVAIAVRATLYTVIDTYCWQTGVRYLLCVYPLLPVASLVSVEAGVRQLAGVLRRRASRPASVAQSGFRPTTVQL